jgi:transcriptional regulator with XRE-family HTH domain
MHKLRGVNHNLRYLKYAQLMNTFRENLREELDYQDISVKVLSEKTGISKRTIENYLSIRGSIPPADYACRISEVLNVTVEWLINGTKYQIPQKDDSEKYLSIIRDFKTLSPEIQNTIQIMIHAAAEAEKTHRAGEKQNQG